MWLKLLMIGPLVDRVSQAWYRRFAVGVLRRAGIRVEGLPLWVSSKAYFDVSYRGSIAIGDEAVISHFVRILTHDFSLDRVALLQLKYDKKFEYARTAEVSIGNHAFIGLGATILPGCDVGEGSIVGAGSVVTRSVPAGVVVAGNPARVLSTTTEYLASRGGDFQLHRRRR